MQPGSSSEANFPKRTITHRFNHDDGGRKTRLLGLLITESVRVLSFMSLPHALSRLQKTDSSVIRDITCQLGSPQCRSRQRHRVVMFGDFEGREIRVVTDFMRVTAEQIAQIYKARWQIEVFFRWIKQHLNIPTLFGTTENAVYGQLFCALIVYVLLNWLFVAAQTSWPQHAVLSFARFSRLFLLQNYLLNG
ncbi:Transposase DDE domain protein [compost metagenome]